MHDAAPPALVSGRCHGAALEWTDDADWPDHPLDLAPGPVPAALHRAVRRRQIEYTAGRLCAARSLAAAGAPVTAVGTAPDRAPVWPPGYLGAITHTTGFAWAVAASGRHLLAVGIDSEPLLTPAVALEVRASVTTPEELAARPAALAEPAWISLLFSAKESVFKCLSPLLRLPLGFAALGAVAVDPRTPAAGSLRLTLRQPHSAVRQPLTVRFCFVGPRLHTACELDV